MSSFERLFSETLHPLTNVVLFCVQYPLNNIKNCVACVTPTRCTCVLQLNYQLFKSQQSSKKTKQKRFLQRIDHSATVADVADIYGAFVSNVLN